MSEEQNVEENKAPWDEEPQIKAKLVSVNIPEGDGYRIYGGEIKSTPEDPYREAVRLLLKAHLGYADTDRIKELSDELEKS